MQPQRNKTRFRGFYFIEDFYCDDAISKKPQHFSRCCGLFSTFLIFLRYLIPKQSNLYTILFRFLQNYPLILSQRLHLSSQLLLPQQSQ